MLIFDLISTLLVVLIVLIALAVPATFFFGLLDGLSISKRFLISVRDKLKILLLLLVGSSSLGLSSPS